MRRLLISVHILRYIVGNKDRIDALAFAILIKQHRVNSLITHATQRKLKSLFGIGADKLRKVIADGLNSGFLRREGDSLVANRLHTNHCLCYQMTKGLFDDAISRSRKNKLTLIGVRRLIETAIIYNTVSMQESCEDTHSFASNSHDLKAIKRARKRENSMLSGTSYDQKRRLLSYARIQALIGRGKSLAIKDAKIAVWLNLLVKTWKVEHHYVNGKVSTYKTGNLRDDAHIIVSMRCNSVWTQFSNIYHIKTDLMKMSNNGNRKKDAA